MKSWTIIGFTANADIWCPPCADATFGPDAADRIDGEGNTVNPIFASDEIEPGEACNQCQEEI
jgi:hypothetical protein